MSSDVISPSLAERRSLVAVNATTGLTQLATLLRRYGLRADHDGIDLAVANPLSRTLVETVRCTSGLYVTAWGYEVGESGDEESVANRLAYLLGVPQ
jgi:hypothetical protein